MTAGMLRWIALLACFATCAIAAPFVPASDAEVVETLPFRPADPRMRELASLRAALAQQPQNLPLAVQVSRRYIELGRITGDPRYAGYAQAALALWWQQDAPPRDVLVLRATLRQRVHEFDAALIDLGRALARNPRDAQARLTRATVLQVRGEFEAARRDCQALQGLAPELIALACATAVDGSNGRLRSSYERLRAALTRAQQLPGATQAWLLTGCAEMAARAGLAADADTQFRAALASDPDDQYLLAAYADFLLDRGRAAEAAKLVEPHIRADGLLLRYALALDALKSGQAAQRVEELRARFAASRLRGDRVHLREEARFTLHLLHDAPSALALAKDNWSVQKEPADARILLESARAAQDVATIRTVREWLARSHLEDIRLTQLLQN